MSKDYYSILGVAKGASKEELKRAYHKMAHKYHPDKEGGDESKFKEINEAYQVLSNDSKRQQYDQFGAEYANQASGGGSGFGGYSGFSGFSGMGGEQVEFDLGDIFGDIFGRQRSQGKGTKKGADISVDVELTLEEAVYGVSKTISLNRNVACAVCTGSGSEPGTSKKSCASCDGKGRVMKVQATILGQFQTASTCQTCYGEGSVPEKPCKHCSGHGTVKEVRDIVLTIPAGIDDGQTVRVNNEGESIGKKGVSGDLYVSVHVKGHNTFSREGMHIRTAATISFSQAVLGDKISLQTLDGKILKIKIPSGIQSGKVLRIPGKGVLGRGDLLIEIVIQTPKKLTRKAKRLIDELKDEGV